METAHYEQKWIWECDGFPSFTYSIVALEELYFKCGQLNMIEALMSSSASTELLVDILENETVATSAIEGEILQRSSVRSSIQKILRMDIEEEYSSNYHIDNLVEIIIDAKTNLSSLNRERLLMWHKALFPTNQSGLRKLVAGAYRTHEEDMRIISGPWEKEKVHYIAPPSSKMEELMNEFLRWLNEDNEKNSMIKAGIAHLYFVLIHPFEDGNGRLARAITDYVLASSKLVNVTFYSIATAIHNDRKEYYEILDRICQSHTLDITVWIEWFMKVLTISIDDTLQKMEVVQIKTKFWDKYVDTHLNDRQKKVIQKMLSTLPKPFEGGMKVNKYMGITKSTRITASRDLADLVQKGVLLPQGKSRGAHYILNIVFSKSVDIPR